jgi:hypothetical protein
MREPDGTSFVNRIISLRVWVSLQASQFGLEQNLEELMGWDCFGQTHVDTEQHFVRPVGRQTCQLEEKCRTR